MAAWQKPILGRRTRKKPNTDDEQKDPKYFHLAKNKRLSPFTN